MELAGTLITRDLLIGMIKKCAEISPDDIYYRIWSWENSSEANGGMIKSNDHCFIKVDVCNNHISFFMGINGSILRSEDNSVQFSLHDEEAKELIDLCKNTVISRLSPGFDSFLTELQLKQ